MKKLDIYLQALRAGAYREETVLEAINVLKSCRLQELSDHRLLTAEVYCQLLRYCHSMYKGKVPDYIIKELLSVFENIEQISVEITEEEKQDSNLITVWFLHELKVRSKSNEVWKMEDKILRESIQVLLQELDSIYFIFDIKVDGQFVFPIHNMIAKVVEKPEFVNINSPLGIYHIHILQLAVRLFKSIDDKQQILQTLVDQCNLRFINYLSESDYIIDTQNLLNYQQNGVMIFHDKVKNKVLIRHKNRNYFEGQALQESEGLPVEEELDYQKNIMGFFVEYELDKSGLLTSYLEVLKSEEGREAFLKLVFDGMCYNVLLDCSIIKRADNSLLPVNPYCHNDTAIIKGQRRDKNGKIYNKDNFPSALQCFKSAALKISKNCVMNRVSFGLAILLLQEENIGVEELQLSEFTDDDWYQSQMLRNWVCRCKNPIEALTFAVGEWQKENDYCALPYKPWKKLENNNIEDHEIEPLNFYPVKSENGWMYQVMECDNPEDWYVLRGEFQEDSEGKFVLMINRGSDVADKSFNQDVSQKHFSIKLEELDDSEELLTEIWGRGEKCYFLYNSKEDRGCIRDQDLLKALWACEILQDRNSFTLETASEISKTQYSEITSMMQLQQAAFEEVGKNIFCDFDSQVYYRLIHNLLWSEINKEKIGSYLKVLMHHQKLEFAEINCDEKFTRMDENTLYVPKDGRESDSVLSSIFEAYLKRKRAREINDMYSNNLELKEDKYYFEENLIENIVFLCDNFECGNATIRMLKAYLDIGVADEGGEEKRKMDQVRASRQKYYIEISDPCEEKGDSSAVQEHLKEVSLKDVVEKNTCTIEVHAYYGTEEGKKKIEKFFEEQHMEKAVVTYERDITQRALQIEEEVKKVWPRLRTVNNIYTVVRQFNMTKMNVFPIEMLQDPEKAICMFVKKDEIKKK